MTKPRVPHTWPDAVTRIAGRVGWAEAARAVRKSEALVRAWSDPATGKRPSLDQALALSAAYARAGGEDAPFVDAFAFQIDHHADRQDACRSSLIAETGVLAREIGEAVAAALNLSKPGASPLDALRAFAEAQQAGGAVETLLRRIAPFLPPDTVPGAGTAGGLREE